MGNMGGVEASPLPLHGRSHSLALTLPPLAALFLERRDAVEAEERRRAAAGADEEEAAAETAVEAVVERAEVEEAEAAPRDRS